MDCIAQVVIRDPETSMGELYDPGVGGKRVFARNAVQQGLHRGISRVTNELHQAEEAHVDGIEQFPIAGWFQLLQGGGKGGGFLCKTRKCACVC